MPCAAKDALSHKFVLDILRSSVNRSFFGCRLLRGIVSRGFFGCRLLRGIVSHGLF